MGNPLDAGHMKPDERLAELADILAAGLLRARIRDVRKRRKTTRTSENCLEDHLEQSVYGLEPSPKGERR